MDWQPIIVLVVVVLAAVAAARHVARQRCGCSRTKAAGGAGTCSGCAGSCPSTLTPLDRP